MPKSKRYHAVVSNPPSDSDSQGSGEDEDAWGSKSHKISNNECAVFFWIIPRRFVVHWKIYE